MSEGWGVGELTIRTTLRVCPQLSRAMCLPMAESQELKINITGQLSQQVSEPCLSGHRKRHENDRETSLRGHKHKPSPTRPGTALEDVAPGQLHTQCSGRAEGQLCTQCSGRGCPSQCSQSCRRLGEDGRLPSRSPEAEPAKWEMGERGRWERWEHWEHWEHWEGPTRRVPPRPHSQPACSGHTV